MNKHAVQKFAIGLVTLLAFLLRTYRLQSQSYWIDEGWTLFYAHLSLPELWSYLQTIRAAPPLYHVLTIFWIEMFGDGEFALRYLSVLFSVMAVPLTYRLAKTLGGFRLGVVAAVLMAISPYQVWHAQDARNYSLLTAASVLSMLSFVSLWRGNNWRWWLLYVLSTFIAVITHYHGLMIIGVQGLFFLITAHRHRRYYLKWAGALLIIVLPLGVWLTFGSTLWQAEHWLPLVGLWESYGRGAAAYSIGELVPQPLTTYLTLVFVFFYGLGLVAAARRAWPPWAGWEMLAFLLCYTLAPNLAAWLYSQWQTPVYLERYLIVVQAGFLIAVSIGVLALADGLRRWARWAGVTLAGAALLLLMTVNGWVLGQHYTDPVYAKPNWRGIIEAIQNFSQPGDAIIMTGDGGEKLFTTYYQGDLPVYFPFNTPVPPTDEALRHLADIAENHERIWFTPYGAPIDPVLENWLAENTFPAWHRWVGRKQLALYDTHASLNRTETIDAVFTGDSGQQVRLVQIDLPDAPTPAGDLLPLSLTWQTGAPLSDDVQLSLRLSNKFGDVFTQSDWPPLPGGSSTWPPNQPITDRRSLWIPPDTPPGNYLLQLVVYNPATGQPLGQPATIPDIHIGAAQISPPVDALAIPNVQSTDPNSPVSLIGSAFPPEIQPGQEMWLWLFSLAQTDPLPDTTLRVTLDNGEETFSTDYSLAKFAGSPENWQPGQVRRMVFHIPTSPRLGGDSAQITVTLLMGNQSLEFSLGQVELSQRSRQFEPPSPATAKSITFGDPPLLTLVGYTLPIQNPTPNIQNLMLFWQAGAEIDTNYTVFVQLLNEAGQVVAQIDRQPLSGAAPTTTWLPGEYLTDPYMLTVPPDLPPGNYQLIAGMYNPATGERLTISSGEGHVVLEKMTIE